MFFFFFLFLISSARNFKNFEKERKKRTTEKRDVSQSSLPTPTISKLKKDARERNQKKKEIASFVNSELMFDTLS